MFLEVETTRSHSRMRFFFLQCHVQSASDRDERSERKKTNKNFLVRYLRYRLEKGMVEVTARSPGPAEGARMSSGSVKRG